MTRRWTSNAAARALLRDVGGNTAALAARLRLAA
jgi:hypothetical protein